MHVDVGKLLDPAADAAPDVGAVHVQTDDADAVERVLRQYLPRIDRNASAAVERGTTWTAVRVEPTDRGVLAKLASELSFRFGVTLVLALERGAVVRFVLHDQGRVVDEYLSVPEYYGPLPPGDVLALRANPTVVSRLTGADPEQIRRIARSAVSIHDLPRRARAVRAAGGRARRRAVITLYDAARCPYCARVRIVLAEKGVPHEPVEIDLPTGRRGSTRRTRPGSVPVLEEDTLVLPESEVIMEYLEERFPEPALLPADPAARALERWRVHRFGDALGDDYYAFRRGDANTLAERLEALPVETSAGAWPRSRISPG